MLQQHKQIVRRFYEEMWNLSNFQLAEELLSDELRLHGTSGLNKQGRQGFIDYADTIHAVFPDFNHAIDELIAEEDKVVTRLTFSGTQRQPLFGQPACGKKVTYSGMTLFTFTQGKISEIWLLSDLYDLWRQINSFNTP